MAVTVALKEVQDYFGNVQFDEETVKEIRSSLGVEVSAIDVAGINGAVGVLLAASKKVEAYNKLVDILHPAPVVTVEKPKRIRRPKAVVQAEREAIARAKAEAANKGQ